jgi:hypothetical protein
MALLTKLDDKEAQRQEYMEWLFEALEAEKQIEREAV